MAAIDDIAFNLSDVKRGKTDAEMAKLGLADPAVAFEDGKVTLMIRSTAYNKVLSAEISVELVADGKLQFTLSATRIGKLRVPRGFLTGKLRALSKKLAGEGASDIARTLAGLLSAIDGQPISPPDTWLIQGVGVAIESITIANGQLTLGVRSIPPARR